MRCLVTGGFGFMGSWVVMTLARQGHDVFLLSRSNAGRQFISLSPEEKAKVFFIQGDIVENSPESLASLLPEALDVCIHAASCNDAFLPEYGAKALLGNVLGTRNLLEALCLKGGELPLFIYPSTFHVYGRADGHIDENTPPAPYGDYAVSHFAAEEYCRMYTRTKGLPSIVLRCTNGYGAPACTPFGKWYLLFPDMCKQAFKLGQIELRSPADIRRDFIWMGHVAETVIALLTRKDLSGQCFNLGKGQAMSIGDVANIVAQVLSDYFGKIIKVNAAAPDSGQKELVVNCTKLKEITGIVPSCHFEQETLGMLTFLRRYGEA